VACEVGGREKPIVPPAMQDFFSNHIITFFVVIGLLIYLLSKGLGSGLQKGLGKVLVLIIVFLVLMSLFSKGSEMAKAYPLSKVPGKLFWWAVGKVGGQGASALGSLNTAAGGMQDNYDGCLYRRLQLDHLTTQLIAQCPGVNALHPDAASEMCLETVLGEYNPTDLQYCRSEYKGIGGLTHELMKPFCNYFPNWCASPK
jgi:hypothetical protein